MSVFPSIFPKTNYDKFREHVNVPAKINRFTIEAMNVKVRQSKAIGGVWLQETQITDAGLKQLSGLTTLGEICLAGSKVTAAGVEAFRKARPQCGIAWEAKSPDK